ncbi:MAG: energy-coupling factor ABC transporter permease [Chloroflexi bacterium]|nr:energy-coupling factor ABC transporter permease [Chloroflexota bacterium]
MNRIFLKPVVLHIPDGFLSLTIALIFWAITICFIGLAIQRTRKQFNERQIPLMGIMAAFIFAAQMLNFPVAGGTSGHFLGGALAAIVLGPWAAMLVMATVVGVQALIFQDGGLIVMGANIFNMGLLTATIGYGLYQSTAARGKTTRLAVAGVAAWLSVIAGALATAFQLWLSGTSALRIVFPAMLGVHMIIGVGEALITVAALAFISQTRPDLLAEGDASTSTTGKRGWVVAGLLISLLVVLISPLASAFPDGLERVAEDMGFIEAGLSAPYEILPDYTLQFLGESSLSTILAGAVGVLIVAGLVVGLMRLLRRNADTASKA